MYGIVSLDVDDQVIVSLREVELSLMSVSLSTSGAYVWFKVVDRWVE
jgi:hypothetical protein